MREWLQGLFAKLQSLGGYNDVTQMSVVDWGIVIALLLLLVGTLIFCQRFVKSTADFLAANRCAGRYLLCITGGIASIGAISIVANFQQYYIAGFAPVWWSFLSGPLGLLIAITGQGQTYDVWLEIGCVAAAIALILFVRESIGFFISKKVSILHWILYLCTVEILPFTLLWQAAVRLR
jgi:hypothetical protein